MDAYLLNAPAVLILAIVTIILTARIRRLEWELRELRHDLDRADAKRPYNPEPLVVEDTAATSPQPLPKMTARFK